MQWPLLRTVCLRVLLLVSLTTSERRVHPRGDAFCILTKPSAPGRVAAVLLGIVLALPVVLLVAYAPVLFWAVVLLLGILLAPSALLVLRSRGPRRTLAGVGPAGPTIGVHTVTSLTPGHGGAVMEAVVEEADNEGWSLVLDAANDRLARYYGQFGFTACGKGVPMPWGETVVRMMRRPAIEEAP